MGETFLNDASSRSHQIVKLVCFYFAFMSSLLQIDVSITLGVVLGEDC